MAAPHQKANLAKRGRHPSAALANQRRAVETSALLAGLHCRVGCHKLIKCELVRQAGWQEGYARVIQADVHMADTLNCFLIIAPIYPFKRNYCTSVATSVARLGLSTRGGVGG